MKHADKFERTVAECFDGKNVEDMATVCCGTDNSKSGEPRVPKVPRWRCK